MTKILVYTKRKKYDTFNGMEGVIFKIVVLMKKKNWIEIIIFGLIFYVFVLVLRSFLEGYRYKSKGNY